MSEVKLAALLNASFGDCADGCETAYVIRPLDNPENYSPPGNERGIFSLDLPAVKRQASNGLGPEQFFLVDGEVLRKQMESKYQDIGGDVPPVVAFPESYAVVRSQGKPVKVFSRFSR